MVRWRLTLCSLETAVGAVEVLAYARYVRWSRLGLLISLARGSVNRGGLPLAIVVCSFSSSLIFGTMLNSFVYSAPSVKPASPLTNDRASRAFHQPSLSASAVEARSESKDDITIVETVTTPQPSLFSGHSPPQHPPFHPSLERSRTPDPPGDDLTSAGHVVLSRFSTAPPFESFADSLMANRKHDPRTRYILSTTKLTKMSFSARDSLHSTVPNPVSP